MFYQGRDPGIARISSIPSRRCHGMGLGVIMFDDDTPGFPGDVRNPSGFPYPIQYQIAEGVDHMSLVVGQDIDGCRRATIEAAKKLEHYGCRALVGECGYFALFQKDVANAVGIPVFLSSLLQVPLAQMVIADHKTVAVAAALKSCLTEAHLDNAGITDKARLKIFGVEDEYDCPEFSSLWDMEKRPSIPTVDDDKAARDFVTKTRMWAPWFWSAPVSPASAGPFKAPCICRFSIGARLWITPIWWSPTAIFTATSDPLPTTVGVTPDGGSAVLNGLVQ